MSTLLNGRACVCSLPGTLLDGLLAVHTHDGCHGMLSAKMVMNQEFSSLSNRVLQSCAQPISSLKVGLLIYPVGSENIVCRSRSNTVGHATLQQLENSTQNPELCSRTLFMHLPLQALVMCRLYCALIICCIVSEALACCVTQQLGRPKSYGYPGESGDGQGEGALDIAQGRQDDVRHCGFILGQILLGSAAPFDGVCNTSVLQHAVALHLAGPLRLQGSMISLSTHGHDFTETMVPPIYTRYK